MILGSEPVLSYGALALLQLFGCNTKKSKTTVFRYPILSDLERSARGVQASCRPFLLP